MTTPPHRRVGVATGVGVACRANAQFQLRTQGTRVARSLSVKSALLTWLVLGSAAVNATPDGIRVYTSPEDRQITEGETIIDGNPGDVYATVLDYTKWPQIFPEIEKVEVTSQKGVDARVTLISRGDHHDNVHFHNQPAARMVWFEDTGGHADVWVEIMFIPGKDDGTTRVHTRLYANVKGFASLVVGDGDVKKQREARVTSDLVQLRAYFRRR